MIKLKRNMYGDYLYGMDVIRYIFINVALFVGLMVLALAFATGRGIEYISNNILCILLVVVLLGTMGWLIG